MNIIKIIYALPITLAILIVWQGLAFIQIIDINLIPPPSKILYAIIEWAKSGELMIDFLNSIWRAIIGLVIGASIGIILGLLTGRSKIIDLLITPIMNTLKAFPPVAMLPIFITLWGIGDFSKIFSIAFATIFPLWVNTHIGASTIPSEYIRSAKLLSKSRTKTLLYVIIPASLSSMIAGFRISIAISFIMLYVSELAGASNGLGYQIASSHLAYRMDRMLGALIVLGFTASLFDLIFNKVIKHYFPWLESNKLI